MTGVLIAAAAGAAIALNGEPEIGAAVLAGGTTIRYGLLLAHRRRATTAGGSTSTGGRYSAEVWVRRGGRRREGALLTIGPSGVRLLTGGRSETHSPEHGEIRVHWRGARTWITLHDGVRVELARTSSDQGLIEALRAAGF